MFYFPLILRRQIHMHISVPYIYLQADAKRDQDIPRAYSPVQADTQYTHHSQSRAQNPSPYIYHVHTHTPSHNMYRRRHVTKRQQQHPQPTSPDVNLHITHFIAHVSPFVPRTSRPRSCSIRV
ncbi:unnamed protein product [Periconia digitata]|uniref:Uncharacterized protein n=1 Tax=Periconia digitata TaxID=1303443 RepID=A0A9W4XVD7_9PLEO|nr:unnamed protein product [Periconia digitata]